MRILKAGSWVVIVLLSLNGFAARAEITNSPWARVVMIGSSATAGFVLSEPFGGSNTLNCRLSFYVDAAIKVPHPPIHNYGQAMFFMNPDGAGPLEVNQALAQNPTLVVGVDFLFWFCYGTGRTDAERLQRFETGLKLLDSIKCPLVIGDIPDASYATNTGIISASQVPSGKARAAANERLREWASLRPEVSVVPLADFMSTVMADKQFSVHGQTLPAGKSRAILQADQLHPTPHGAAMLALGVLDTLTSKSSNFPPNDIRWNIEEVHRLGYEAAQPPSHPATNLPPATVR